MKGDLRGIAGMRHSRIVGLARRPLQPGAAFCGDRAPKARLTEIFGRHLDEAGIVAISGRLGVSMAAEILTS